MSHRTAALPVSWMVTGWCLDAAVIAATGGRKARRTCQDPGKDPNISTNHISRKKHSRKNKFSLVRRSFPVLYVVQQAGSIWLIVPEIFMVKCSLLKNQTMEHFVKIEKKEKTCLRFLLDCQITEHLSYGQDFIRITLFIGTCFCYSNLSEAPQIHTSVAVYTLAWSRTLGGAVGAAGKLEQLFNFHIFISFTKNSLLPSSSISNWMERSMQPCMEGG